MDHDTVESGLVEGLTSAEKRELVELRRRNRALETEIEIINAVALDEGGAGDLFGS